MLTYIKYAISPVFSTVVICSVIERPHADTRDAVWYSDARKSGATGERSFTDDRDSVSNCYARKYGAVAERIFSDTRDATGIVMLVSPVQPENANSPMLVRLYPSVMLVSPLQLENAKIPMLITLSGIVMLISPVQPKNA